MANTTIPTVGGGHSTMCGYLARQKRDEAEHLRQSAANAPHGEARGGLLQQAHHLEAEANGLGEIAAFIDAQINDAPTATAERDGEGQWIPTLLLLASAAERAHDLAPDERADAEEQIIQRLRAIHADARRTPATLDASLLEEAANEIAWIARVDDSKTDLVHRLRNAARRIVPQPTLRAPEVTDDDVRRTGVAHPGFTDDEFLFDFIEQAKGAGGLREDEVTRLRLIAQRLRQIDYDRLRAARKGTTVPTGLPNGSTEKSE